MRKKDLKELAEGFFYGTDRTASGDAFGPDHAFQVTKPASGHESMHMQSWLESVQATLPKGIWKAAAFVAPTLTPKQINNLARSFIEAKVPVKKDSRNWETIDVALADPNLAISFDMRFRSLTKTTPWISSWSIGYLMDKRLTQSYQPVNPKTGKPEMVAYVVGIQVNPDKTASLLSYEKSITPLTTTGPGYHDWHWEKATVEPAPELAPVLRHLLPKVVSLEM